MPELGAPHFTVESRHGVLAYEPDEIWRREKGDDCALHKESDTAFGCDSHFFGHDYHRFCALPFDLDVNGEFFHPDGVCVDSACGFKAIINLRITSESASPGRMTNATGASFRDWHRDGALTRRRDARATLRNLRLRAISSFAAVRKFRHACLRQEGQILPNFT
jgi:hypothetical protein